MSGRSVSFVRWGGSTSTFFLYLGSMILALSIAACTGSKSNRQDWSFETPEGGLETPTLQWFQTDVFSGNASVSVPVRLSSGPGGFAPSLSLSYSSFRGAQENDEADGGIAGRGWALKGLSYIERKVLVVGGVSYPIKGERVENDTLTRLKFFNCGAGQRLCDRAVVRTADGTRYEFGGIAGHHRPPRDLLRPEHCTGTRCDQAHDMFRAISQWTKWQYNDNDLEPGRLMLRAMSDRFGNRIEFFYELEAVKASANNGQLAVRHIRPHRIVWAAATSFQQAWGDLANRVINGQTRGEAVGQALTSLEQTLDTTAHLEARFRYIDRIDGRHAHPGTQEGGQVWSSAFHLAGVDAKVFAASGPPELIYRTELRHQMLSDGMAYMTEVARGIEELHPPMRFAYHPDNDQREQGYHNTLLYRVDNGRGGVIEFTYADPGIPGGGMYNSIHGVVLEKKVHDGRGAWSAERYRRDLHFGRSQRQGKRGYAGSRMVMVETRRSCEGDPYCHSPSQLESCTEYRFFTNLETFPSGQRYDFSDGETVDTDFENENFKWLEALSGQPYQVVSWHPVNGACPTPGENQWRAYKATEWSKVKDTKETRYRVTLLGEHEVPRVEVVEVRSKTFSVQREDGLEGPFQQLRTTTTYDAFSNPRVITVYRDTHDNRGGPSIETTHTYHGAVVEDGMHLLTDRLSRTVKKAHIPEQGLLVVAETRWPSYHVLSDHRATGLPTQMQMFHGVAGETVTDYRYDGSGNVVETAVSGSGVDPIRTLTEWDAIYRTWPTLITRGAGTAAQHKQKANYDKKWRLSETVGPYRQHTTIEKTTSYGYDGRGRLTTVTRRPSGAADPLVTTTTYTDGSQGRAGVIRTCAYRGERCTTQLHDGWGRVIKKIDAGGVATSTTYDGLGRVMSVSTPYDTRHISVGPRPKKTTIYHVETASTVTVSPSGVRTQVCPGLFGHVGITETRISTHSGPILSCNQNDATTRGMRRTRIHQKHGHVRHVEAMPYGSTTGIYTTFDRDTLGRVWKIYDGNGRSHHRRYDHDLLVHSSDPDRGATDTSHDALGRIIRLSTPESRNKGGVIETRYLDGLGRATDVLHPDGSHLKNYYDSYPQIRAGQPASNENTVGKLVEQSFTDASGTVFTERHEYDPGQRLRVTMQHHSGAPWWRFMYSYNPKTGEKVCTKIERGAPQALWRRLDLSTGRLTGIALADGNCSDTDEIPVSHQWLASSYSYVKGRLHAIDYSDGSRDEWRYADDGRLQSIKHRQDGSAVHDFQYAYNAYDNIREIHDAAQNDRDTYDYDGLSRLTSAVQLLDGRTVSRSYSYDKLGNFLHYAFSNRQFSYDSLGRLESGIARNGQPFDLIYGDNGSGRVVTRTLHSDGSQVGSTTSFAYDALGRMRSMQIDPVNGTSPTLAVTHQYGLSGLTFAERLATPERSSVRYGLNGYEEETLEDGQVIRRLKVSSGLSTIVLTGTQSGSLSPYRTLHKDYLNSTRWSSSSNQSPAIDANFTPFGASLDGQANRMVEGFTGQISKGYGGLVYFKARFYDPYIGRFLGPDAMISNPLNGQDYNAYAYVHNDPIAKNDPDGMAPACGAIGLPCAGGAPDESFDELSHEAYMNATALEWKPQPYQRPRVVGYYPSDRPFSEADKREIEAAVGEVEDWFNDVLSPYDVSLDLSDISYQRMPTTAKETQLGTLRRTEHREATSLGLHATSDGLTLALPLYWGGYAGGIVHFSENRFGRIEHIGFTGAKAGSAVIGSDPLISPNSATCGGQWFCNRERFIYTLAHELSHALGGLHDGSTNSVLGRAGSIRNGETLPGYTLDAIARSPFVRPNSSGYMAEVTTTSRQ